MYEKKINDNNCYGICCFLDIWHSMGTEKSYTYVEFV